MSGILNALVAGGGNGIVTSLVLGINDTNVAVSGNNGHVSFETNGAITGFNLIGSASTKWFNPLITGIGNNYWIKFTLNSGDAWDAGLTSGTVYALTSDRTVAWSFTGYGTETANVTVNIYADSGGTQLVATNTFNVMLASEP